MKSNRLISALLTVVMVLGVLSGTFVINISAADSSDEKDGPTRNYLTQAYATPEEKLADMEKKYEGYGYEIYVEPWTAEVAFLDTASGQILFSNPYDIATTNGSQATKQQLLSQVIIKYTDNNTDKYMYSYPDCALNQQFKVKNIKNGIRIEYTIGREETRRLVPRMIEKSRFEEQIVAYITDDFSREKLTAFYTLQDLSDPSLTDADVKAMETAFPITEKYAVYVFDPDAKEKDYNKIEEYIKEYCPHYTYESLDYDHALVEYTGSDKAPPLFKLALEYSIDELGPTVRVPVNGLRFDESSYQLSYVSILPYIGAGSNKSSGYTFVPDGSGALFRFEDLVGKSATTTGKLYGQDYAYHNITGSLQEVMRLPVYGVVEDLERERTVDVEVVIPEYTDPITGVVTPEQTVTKQETEKYIESRGFLAIIEEGDAISEISSVSGGSLHKYNYVNATFSPRPKDSYNLADAISVGSNSTWTVVSSRKYVGNYKMRFIMLTDPTIAEEKGLTDYYEAGENGWLGMAVAYRDYLEAKGLLKRLTADDVKSDIPLYIETFGAIDTTKRFMSIPYTTQVAFTSFEDIKTMFDELKGEDITNINFKLTGYANGGMYSTAPAKLRWEKAVGGKNGFKDLVSYAKENGFGVFPDFDFAYVTNTSLFDGFSLSKDAIKTIDDRYTTKRFYSAARQSYETNFSMAVSPSVFDKFYTKLTDKYLEYDPLGISVATLGTDLNSDFDEDDPYNREDAKVFTEQIFEKLSKDYPAVMTDGGNSYVLSYVDHLLNVALDSSRYSNASDSVPFVGAVLHGYLNFAGEPINMAGDIDYEFLKAIENGANLYFILSKNNTELLKQNDDLSIYYSVRYDIWFEELVERYKALNDILADLQTKLIVGHEFLLGERIPDEDEVEADKAAEELKAQKEAEKAAAEAAKAALKEAFEKRKAEEAGLEYDPSAEPSTDEPVTTDPTTDEPTEDTDGEDAEAPEEGTDDTEEPAETDDGYVKTKYTSDDNSIVKVTYEGGVSFILNYNEFDVTVVDNETTYTIPGFGYVVIK